VCQLPKTHQLSASWEAKGRDVWKCIRGKGEKRAAYKKIVQYMQGNIYIINRA